MSNSINTSNFNSFNGFGHMFKVAMKQGKVVSCPPSVTRKAFGRFLPVTVASSIVTTITTTPATAYITTTPGLDENLRLPAFKGTTTTTHVISTTPSRYTITAPTPKRPVTKELSTRLSVGLTNLGRLLGRLIPATTIVAKVMATPIAMVNKTRKALNSIVISNDMMYGNRAMGCASANEFGPLTLDLAWDTEGIVRVREQKNMTLLSVKGIDVMHIDNNEGIISNGAVVDIIKVIVIVKTMIDEERKLHTMSSPITLSKSAVISKALEYVSKFEGDMLVSTWKKIMSAVTANSEEGLCNPLRMLWLENLETYSFVQGNITTDSIILGLRDMNPEYKTRWQDTFPRTKTITKDDGNKETMTLDGAMSHNLLINGAATEVKGTGVPWDFAVSQLPMFTNNGDETYNAIDFRSLAKVVARTSGLSSNIAADLNGKEYDAFTLILQNECYCGEAILFPSFRRGVEIRQDMRYPFFEVENYKVHAPGNGPATDIVKVQEKVMLGQEYYPGDVILSDSNGPVLKNNSRWPVTVTKFRTNPRRFYTIEHTDLRVVLTTMVNPDVVKFRPVLRQEWIGTNDLDNASALIGKALCACAKDDLNITIGKKSYRVDMIMGSEGRKLDLCTINAMRSVSKKHGFKVREVKFTVCGKTYKAIAGYMPWGIENVIQNKRWNDTKQISMKFPYVMDYYLYLNGLSETGAISYTEEMALRDWWMGSVDKSQKEYFDILDIWTGKHVPGTTMPSADFLAMTADELLNGKNKCFSIVMPNGKHYPWPSGEVARYIYSRPVTGNNCDDYMDYLVADHENRVMKSELMEYYKKLRLVAKGATIDSMVQSFKALYDIAVIRPVDAFRGNYDGARFSNYTRKEVKSGQCHVADEYYTKLKAKGVTHSLIMRTPTIYPSWEICEVRPLSELNVSNGLFEFDPGFANQAALFTHKNIADALRGDNDGDPIFMIFLPTGNITDIASKLIRFGINDKFAVNQLALTNKKIGWALALDDDKRGYEHLLEVMSDKGKAYPSTFTKQDVLDAVMSAAKAKHDIAMVTANMWCIDTVLYNATVKQTMQAYKDMSNPLVSVAIFGHNYLAQLAVQATIDSVKDDGNTNIYAGKTYTWSALNNGKNIAKYEDYAKMIGESSEAVSYDLLALRYTAGLLKSKYPNDKDKIGHIVSGTGMTRDGIINKMIRLVTSDTLKLTKDTTMIDDSQLPAPEDCVFNLIADLKRDLTGDCAWVYNLCSPLHEYITMFCNRFELPIECAVAPKTMANYVASTLDNSYSIKPGMVQSNGLTSRIMGTMCTSLSNAMAIEDRVVEIVRALESGDKDSRRVITNALYYRDSNKALVPSKAFGSLIQGIKDSTMLIQDEATKLEIGRSLRNRALGEIFLAMSSRHGKTISTSLEYVVGTTLLDRAEPNDGKFFSRLEEIQTEATVWAEAKQ